MGLMEGLQARKCWLLTASSSTLSRLLDWIFTLLEILSIRWETSMNHPGFPQISQMLVAKQLLLYLLPGWMMEPDPGSEWNGRNDHPGFSVPTAGIPPPAILIQGYIFGPQVCIFLFINNLPGGGIITFKSKPHQNCQGRSIQNQKSTNNGIHCFRVSLTRSYRSVSGFK